MGVGNRALLTGLGVVGGTHTHTHTHTLLPHPPPGTLWVKCYTGVRYFCVWTSLLSLVGSQPSYLTFLNLIDLIWKSSCWRSNEREIPPPRPCCEHSAHPRPLCMDLRCHCRGGNRVQGKYKAGWWVREQQRGTEEVVRMQNSVIMPESCNRQDFVLMEEAALRESVLSTGGKGWRPPARCTEVGFLHWWRFFWVDIPQWGRFWGHFSSKHWLCDPEASCPRASVDTRQEDLGEHFKTSRRVLFSTCGSFIV